MDEWRRSLSLQSAAAGMGFCPNGLGEDDEEREVHHSVDMGTERPVVHNPEPNEVDLGGCARFIE
jgi:hypothetical protein